jgi:hypothetical protein
MREKTDYLQNRKLKKKTRAIYMDPLSTTESLKRDLTSALSSSSSREQHSLDVVKKRIQRALDFVVLSDGKTSEDRLKKIFIANDAEDASRVVVAGEEEEEELDKIETLAQFFYQCASVDLTPRAFDERLENLTTTTPTTTSTPGGGGGGEKVGKKAKISEETKDALRQTYVKNKTRLTRACRDLAEIEDEKTTERLENIEWRMSVETSSRLRQNRRHAEKEEDDVNAAFGGDRLRYVVKMTLRSLDEKTNEPKRRVEVFECSYETLKKLSDDVDKCREKSEDARARRIRRFVRRPT